MLGHMYSMGTLRLYELLRKMQKHLGGGAPAENFWNFTASQTGFEAIW